MKIAPVISLFKAGDGGGGGGGGRPPSVSVDYG